MDDRVPDSLREGQRRARTTEAASPARSGAPAGQPLLALQRSAGNAAVAALLSARARPGGGERARELDGALAEAGRPQPDLPVLERGLSAAQALGVPVDLDGAATGSPPSAPAVTRTGSGPESVPGGRPAPPPAPTPPIPALSAAAGRSPAPAPGRTPTARTATPPATARTATPAPVQAPAAGGRADPFAAVAPTTPAADPAFTAVTAAVARVARESRAHPPAAAEVRRAQDAALPPADDRDSQAKAAKVDTMDAQPAGSFDRRAFTASVKAAVDARSPRTLEEADGYRQSGRAGEVKDEVRGLVGGNTREAAAAVETATAAPPDASRAVTKPVTPMAAADAGGPPTAPDLSGAVPKPVPAERLDLVAGARRADARLADAGVTEHSLAASHEPDFSAALAAKQEAARHAHTAPAGFRQQEAAVLGQARAAAGDRTQAAVTGMHGSRAAVLAAVTGQKTATKAADEARRARVSARVQEIYGAAEAAVQAILGGIDAKVETAFDTGEKAARARFEGFVETRMSAFRKDRYGGWLGGYRWLRDKVAGPPAAVDEIFAAGKEQYLTAMDGVISTVADVVGADLAAAKRRIAAGKAEIAAYARSLPGELRQVGDQATEQVGNQFDRLENDVSAKQDALVQSLAAQYSEARQGLDGRVQELQEENRGLVDRAVGAVEGVVRTIGQLKDLLLGVLARAAGAIGRIVSDPIGFLGRFVTAIRTGVTNFADNIGEHLKKGLQAWLFGTLTAGGVELPETLDLKGVLRLVASILGLTWAHIRSRIVKKIGEPVMSRVESGLEVVRVLVTEGVGGLWKVVQEKVGDLREMVLGRIQDMVVTQIIKAGVTWLVSMLNPAGTFIKACKAIYDVVVFFVERASQIREFVDSVLDSVESIAGGGVGAVAGRIEQTLSKALPVVIGFLASALGLGGISEKIRKIVETVQRPIAQAIDWVVGKAVGYGRKLLGGAVGRVGDRITAGKAAVKAKVDAARATVEGKADTAQRFLRGLVAKPISVDGVRHTVKGNVDGGRLSFTVASVEKPLAVHQEAAAAMAVKQGNRALADEALAVIAQASRIQGDVDPRNADEARVRAAVAELATVIQAVWARIGYQGVPPRESFSGDPTKGVVGEVGRHADQGTRGYSGADVRAAHDRLESEHVVPRAWLQAFVRGFLRINMSKAEDKSLYRQMTTIMIYKGAADYKTEKGKLTDNVVVGRIKELIAGHPRAKDPAAVADAVRRGFDGPIASRVRLTKEARNVEHAASGRTGEPRPSDSAIEGAALRQLLDVVEFLARTVTPRT